MSRIATRSAPSLPGWHASVVNYPCRNRPLRGHEKLPVTASDLEPERSASERFKIVMSRVVEASHPYLGPPVTMSRVTSTGCAEVA